MFAQAQSLKTRARRFAARVSHWLRIVTLASLALFAPAIQAQSLQYGSPGGTPAGGWCPDSYDDSCNGHDGGHGTGIANQVASGKTVSSGTIGIDIDTSGGKGSDSDLIHVVGFNNSLHWGGNGGTAGDIGDATNPGLRVENSTISGTQYGIKATADGGNGGFYGNSDVRNNKYDWGSGGDGGVVNLELRDTAVGANQYGVYATSKGGCGTYGAYTVGGVTLNHDAGLGGNGKNVVVQLDGKSNITVSNNRGDPGAGPQSHPDCWTLVYDDTGAVSGSAAPTTPDNYSAGIFATSQGGQGGNEEHDKTFGNGHDYAGHGGNAGTVTVGIGTGSGIVTHGDYAPAIVAISRGGDGGTARSQGVIGAGGGIGGRVDVTNAGSITTDGAHSPGMRLESEGGSGGSGGDGTWGKGNPGGDGGPSLGVSASNSGAISTAGYDSSGIEAYSEGGGGSDGGGAGFNGPGGYGGNGGGAGAITIDNLAGGGIHTQGGFSYGIYAQSGGGSGGNGGTSGKISGVGGKGGDGARGGDVTVDNDGSIVTEGDHSVGVLMHSIGGDGGVGGDANVTGLIVSIGIGGKGGNGNVGGNVSYGEAGHPSNGSITTSGADAAALDIKSIGGGGGNGGASSVSSVGVGLNVSVSIGGDGGTGNDAGNVDAYLGNGAVLSTSGQISDGILAQSIGGGGGNGGAARTLADFVIGPQLFPDWPTVTANVNITVGGKGGVGGNGGQVNIDTAGTVRTAGAGSIGIFAQSVGGGGGNGGAGTAPSSATVIGPGKATYSFNASVGVTVGGSGAGGGNGGKVAVTNRTGALVSTEGDDASGILAQSIGGGGGNGGSAQVQSSSTLSAALGPAKSLPALLKTILEKWKDGIKPELKFKGLSSTTTVTLGGNAGAGGTGGEVSLANAGTIRTQGDSSSAMVAQSIGGGGGNGGIANSAGAGSLLNTIFSFVSAITSVQKILEAPQISLNPSVQFGGDGAFGGNGGTVTATSTGTITTEGTGSAGIVAQSVGGGGGNGGVNGTNLKKLLTDWSGSGADAQQALKDITSVLDQLTKWGMPTINNLFKFEMGGKNGAAGAGGKVTASIDAGSVTTGGDNAVGVLAQSIGGGGGNASASDYVLTPETCNVTTDLGTQYTADSISGGFLGNGGDTATASNAGTVTTRGNGAAGLVSQSIGGGGGAVAIDVQRNSATEVNADLSGTLGATLSASSKNGLTQHFTGNAATTTSRGQVATFGALAPGMVAQSIGGGGGIVSVVLDGLLSAANLTLGGSFTSSSFYDASGGNASASVDGGSVRTSGALGFGVVAQSVGGGGGYVDLLSTLGPIGSDLDIAFGADHSLGNNGGSATVEVAKGASIQTSGLNAHAIIAQSVAGGGGIFAALADSVKLSGRSPSKSGSSQGGDVKVDVDGSVTTEGAGAAGVLAQSVGGGGGLVVDTQVVNYGPDMIHYSDLQSTQGAGGAVEVDIGGQIQTRGAQAPGIVALSLSGGAVLMGDGIHLQNPVAGNGDPGGAVTVNVGKNGLGGSVAASGSGSAAIVAMSVGTAPNGENHNVGGSEMHITIDNHASVTSTGAGGIGIFSFSPNATYITNKGTLYAEKAIVALSSDTTTGAIGLGHNGYGGVVLDNPGTLRGSVHLDGQGSSIANEGIFRPLDEIYIGGNGALTNAGTLDLSDDGKRFSGTTTLTGQFSQTANGTTVFGLDFTQNASNPVTSTLLKITGATSWLGKLEFNPRNPYKTAAPITLATFATPMASDAFGATVMQGPNFEYTPHLSADGKTLSVDVDAKLQLAASAATNDAVHAADYLQRLWDSGYAAAGAFFNYLVPLRTQADYIKLLGNIENDAALNGFVRTTNESFSFFNRLMGCNSFVGGGAERGDGDCVWGRVISDRTRSDGDAQDSEYRANQTVYQIGGQRQIADGWFLGGSFGYADAVTYSATRATSSMSGTWSGGLMLKRQAGPWEFAAAIKAGYESADTLRRIEAPGYSAIAAGKPDIKHFGVRLHAAREFAFDRWYLKPMVDLDTMLIDQSAYRERGADLFDLAVARHRQTSIMATPSVELGGRFNLGTVAVRPFLNAGLSLRGNRDWTARAWLDDMPRDQAPFEMTVQAPKTYRNLSAGVEILANERLELRAEYGLRDADRFSDRTATFRAALHF